MDSGNLSKVKAVLWEKKKDKFVQCNICHNRCLIAPGSVSRCLSRKNVNGEMELNTFGLVSSLADDPIEKKPLYHFHPGTRVFSVGGWGCNFRCLHCQNWNISQVPKEVLERIRTGAEEYSVSPQKSVELAEKHNCQGLAWTYNEPAIWLEYTIESARLAKEKGLYTVYVTNGYITPEALDLIAPYLDAFRVDLKSFDDEFYREICGVKDARGVFETTIHAKELEMHIETVTNIIPTHNDSEETLKNIAGWIVKNLGEDTPWHVTRFFPYCKLMHLPPTPLETLEKAVKIGRKEGLNFVYKGNVSEESKTICPSCGKTAISRNFEILVDANPDGSCKECNRGLNIIL